MDYTDSQKQIIECDETKDQVVIAVPGAGKTTCIITRIQYLHDVKKIPLETMCYLTYSKRMASDALLKLKKEGLDGIFHAGTIDSLCWKLLEHSDKGFNCEISQIISETKCSRSLADFSKFFENPRHVFIDEAQDLDSDRFQVLSSMFNTSGRMSSCHMTIVGDPRQAIYQGLFQADPQLMLKLRPSAIIRELTDCFRCSPEILKFVNTAFSQMLPTAFYTNIKSTRIQESTPKRKPNLIKYHAEKDNMAICRNEVVDLVVKRIKQLIQKGSEPDDIMVVAPSVRNTSLQLLNRIRTSLMTAKIPSILNKSQPEYDRTLTHMNEKSVYMGTVHSVKGLECKHMLILNHYIGNGAFQKIDKDGNLNPDYNNLLYVAYTRAKDTLDLFETCHIPAKCESIETVSGLEVKPSHDLNSHYNVVCIRSCPLKSDKPTLTAKATENNHYAVTDILKKLSSDAWGYLQNLPMPNTTKCLESLNRDYRQPKFLSDTRDCDIYGIFMELMVARHLAQIQRNRNLMRKFGLLPMILTMKEHDILLKNFGHDALEIPSYKFKYSLTSKDELCEIFRLHKNVTTKNSSDAKKEMLSLKKTLAQREIFVSDDPTLFYSKVQEHLYDLEVICDERQLTADIVSSVWNVALLKIFRQTQLGLYWVQTIDSDDLLPSGVSSWSVYLEEVSSVAEEFIIEEYQYPLRLTGDLSIIHETKKEVALLNFRPPSFTLTGIADLLTTKGDIIDIKCSLSDRVGNALYNRTQLAAYRSMSIDCNDAFILSLFTLNLYKLEPESECVDNVSYCKGGAAAAPGSDSTANYSQRTKPPVISKSNIPEELMYIYCVKQEVSKESDFPEKTDKCIPTL